MYLLLLFMFVQCRSTNTGQTASGNSAGEYYEIRVYQLSANEQVAAVENFLKNAWVPALHRSGIARVGVFKPLTNDTAATKRIYVLTPYASLQQFERTVQQLRNDATLETAGAAYVNAAHNAPVYTRFETILLQAFKNMPFSEVPRLTSPKQNRIYELRSYEGHTEKIYRNKVHMFNEGGEVALFKRLNFNAVFYGDVIAGSRMPNLMYMTSFENMADRDAHWKTFVEDPEWKALSSRSDYQNNVSKADIYLMTATDYSDF
jgi:hypothetical protein